MARPRNDTPEIRTTRESEAMEDYLDKQEMKQAEITEQINYEEVTEPLHYPEDCSQYTEENQMDP